MSSATVDELLIENQELRRRIEEAEESLHAVQASERKRVEETSEENDRHKRQFLATLAHELRNPLAPILTAVELVQLRGTGDPRVPWALDVIQRQTRQLNRLVDDLLDVGRISQGKIQLRLERTELALVIRRAVETSQPLIDADEHQLGLLLPPEPVYVYGDLVRLAQVLSNLLNNAAKYMEPRGHIVLEATRQERDAVIRVRDEGIGISTEIMPHIFEPFVQGSRAISHSPGGLGIGLSLVRTLVRMHGGSVSVSSAGPGKGSEFTVRLPALEEEAPITDRPVPEKAGPGGRSLRVMIVDDNHDAALSLCMLISCWGHDVCTVHDGPSALAQARQYRPDVVLLDLGMPGMCGLEVCRRLRQQPEFAHTVLVALTGYGQEEDRRHTHEAGFNHHWVKPVEPETIQRLFASLSPT